MSKLVFDVLKTGQADLPEKFKEVERLWEHELAQVGSISIAELAERLNALQLRIERVFGNRNQGKEFMAWTAFAHLYSYASGFTSGSPVNSEKLRDAFAMSSCSMEVKFAARAAAAAYGVGLKKIG